MLLRGSAVRRDRDGGWGKVRGTAEKGRGTVHVSGIDGVRVSWQSRSYEFDMNVG